MLFDESVGLLQRARITGFIPDQNEMLVSIINSVASKGAPVTWGDGNGIAVSYSPSLFYNNGLFIGTYPDIGTVIIIGQGSSGKYYFVSFLPDGFSDLPKITDKDLGKILIRGNDNSKITVDTKSNIFIGSDTAYIHTNTGDKDSPDSNLISINFKNENHFTQAYREIGGVIKRDKELNTTFVQNNKLENDDYDPFYKIIGLDASLPANNIRNGLSKNPPLVEHRELVYEFQYESNVTNDLQESLQYGKSKPNNINYELVNRRKSRADTLSLTLLEPNYLIETIKGTVVDIFGNILDLNRVPLPIGKKYKNTLHVEKGGDVREAYLRIRELERKSLAFHFEINARKDLSSKNAKASTLDLLNINSNDNNSTVRSRFFIDIDKEGQFKINVPASSEKGNIPLLTRYENFSNYSTEDNGNPNQFFAREDNLDIFQDSFATAPPILGDKVGHSKIRGSIKLQDSKGEAAPKDRITGSYIKHGTAHHDIMMTCSALDNILHLGYQYVEQTVDIEKIPLLKNIVSDTIIVDGAGTIDKGGPNAGGRSGSINFDGMIELNIGANTIDRQSMWMDLAGGAVINLGRDRKSRSAVVQADGDIYMQIGNFGITTDSRFIADANAKVGAVLDLRIMNSGNCTHMIRCDDKGITIMTPGAFTIHASGDMKIECDARVDINSEQLYLNNRQVKKFGESI
jgi:hypothetical protein